MPTGSLLDTHLTNLVAALVPYRRCESQLARWGADLAHRLTAGGRLLVAGNGGSAAEAQHLTADLLEEIRLLGNLESRSAKAAFVVLVVQRPLTWHSRPARVVMGGWRDR